MSENSKIEWTDATWNPILGCDKISPGCKNCYAIRTAHRLQSNPNPKVAKAFEGLTVIQGGQPNWTGRVNFVEERLEEPRSWRKPSRVFVNSQSDLFHDGLTDEQIARVFQVMFAVNIHTYQVLTKRPERMKAFLSNCGEWEGFITHNANQPGAYGGDGIVVGVTGKWPLPNVWLGVSCENQQTADERIPLLLQTPAAVRWVSAEPLLGPIDLTSIPFGWQYKIENGKPQREPLRSTALQPHTTFYDEGQIDWPRLDWVVCGGESGPNARPMHPDWARSLRDQCQAAGVPFFFKQVGEWAWGSDCRKEELCLYRDGRSCAFTQEAIITEERRSGIAHQYYCGTVVSKIGKKAAGRLLDGKEWSEYPNSKKVLEG